MQLGERPASMILAAAALLLALLIGAIIPLASGDNASREALSWTPPSPTIASPTARSETKALASLTATVTMAPATAAPQPRPAAATPVPTLPTAAPLPTATPAPALTATAEEDPPAATPEGPTASILVEPLNLRTGPGTGFPPLGIARIGDVYTLRGRNADGSWYQICCIQDAPAWVSAEFVAVNGAIDTLPIVP